MNNIRFTHCALMRYAAALPALVLALFIIAIALGALSSPLRAQEASDQSPPAAVLPAIPIADASLPAVTPLAPTQATALDVQVIAVPDENITVIYRLSLLKTRLSHEKMLLIMFPESSYLAGRVSVLEQFVREVENILNGATVTIAPTGQAAVQQPQAQPTAQ